MPYTREDFEKIMQETQIIPEICDIADKLFDLFRENDIQPSKALAAMCYAIGIIMGKDGRDLKDLYPIIEAAYNLAYDHIGGKK